MPPTGRFKRINHEQAYSLDGACTNWAGNFSAACAAPRSATTTISPVSICSATRKRRHGAKIIAASPTASRWRRLRLALNSW